MVTSTSHICKEIKSTNGRYSNNKEGWISVGNQVSKIQCENILIKTTLENKDRQH